MVGCCIRFYICDIYGTYILKFAGVLSAVYCIDPITKRVAFIYEDIYLLDFTLRNKQKNNNNKMKLVFIITIHKLYYLIEVKKRVVVEISYT